VRRRPAAAGLVVATLIATAACTNSKHVTTVGAARSESVTAGDVAKDVWSELPPAPIPARDGASMAWTGKEMLVWGGQSGPHGETLYGDGAAYNPTTRTWRVLPPSPLGSRVEQSAVWTGHEWIIWGGYDEVSSSHFHVAGTGAAYDPGADRWRELPVSPLDGRVLATVVWTGKEAVFLGGLPAVLTNTVRGYQDGAAYDPAADRWRTVPALPAVEDHQQVNPPIAVWAGDRLVVWRQWTRGDANGGPSGTGYDLFASTSGVDGWQLVEQGPDAAAGIGLPIWTGAEVIVPAAPQPLPGFGGGPQFGLHGHRYDPGKNTWRVISHGPVDDVIGKAFWTGQALLELDTHSLEDRILPGDGAVWNPGDDQWTRLARPIDAAPSDAVWTGHEILMWGDADRGLRFGPETATDRTSWIDSDKARTTCEAAGSQQHLTGGNALVAAIDTTAGAMRHWEQTRNGPNGPVLDNSLAATSPSGTYMALCYFDGGEWTPPGNPLATNPPTYNRIRIQATATASMQDGIGCFHSQNCAVGNGEIDIQRPA
jgi:hypothetical protein